MRRAPLLLLLAIVALAFAEVWGAERGLFFRDHTLVYKPLWLSTWIQLREGHWPVLNLGHPSGMPLEASVAAALYTPATLLLLSGDFDFTYDWFVIVHFAIAASGAYLLARRLGAERAPAVAAGAIAALSGPVLSFENLLVGLMGIAYTPWVAIGFLGAIERPSAGATAGLALALALQLQGMMPELVLLDALLFAALVAVRSARPNLRMLASLSGAAVLALLLAAVDLGPLFDGLSGTRRAAGFSYEERVGWAFHPLQLIELFAPGFWAPPDLAFFNVPAVTGSSSDPPYLISLYFGAAIPLALAAPWNDRRTRWIAAGVIIAFLIAAGAGTPLHRILTSMPLLRSSRYAIKYLLFASAGIAALAGMTIARFSVRAKQVAIASLVLGGVCLAAHLTLSMPEGAEALRAYAKPMSGVVPFELYTAVDIIELAMKEMKLRLLHGLVACFAMGALAIAATRWSRNWIPLAAALLLSIDLAAAAAHAVPSAETASAKLPDEALRILGDRTSRVQVSNPPPVPVLDGTPFEIQTAHRARFGLDAIGRIRTFESLDVDAQEVVLWDRIIARSQTLEGDRYRALLARAGVRHYLRSSRTNDPIALEYSDLLGAPIYVHRIPEALPHLQAVTRWRRIEPEARNLMDVLSDASILDEAIVLDAPPELAETSSTSCDASVSPIAVGFDSITARVHAECPVLFVAREIARSRWRALADGRPAPIAIVDLGYMAVPLPAGDHVVELAYASATSGWWPVSALGLLVLAALYTISRRERMTPATATSAMQ